MKKDYKDSFNVKVYVYPDGSVQARSYSKCISKYERIPDLIDSVDSARTILPLQDCPFDSKGAYYDPNSILSVAREREAKKKALSSSDPACSVPDHDRSVAVSLTRTKNKLNQYVRSVKWEWFLTFTVDPTKADSTDFYAIRKKMSNWLNNVKKKYAPNMQYVVVPEQHKSGAWHFHGLFRNIGSLQMVHAINPYTDCEIYQYCKSGKLPVFNCKNWKIGFTTATPIINPHRAGMYILKYITKDLVDLVPGAQRYFCSKNLPLPHVYTHLSYSQDLGDMIYDALVEHKIMSADTSVDYAKKIESDWLDMLVWELSV